MPTQSLIQGYSYDAEFADGQTAEVSASNAIAQSIYAMCDTQGNQYFLLDGIVGHRKNETAIERADMCVQRGSKKQLKKTTSRGWTLCVEWKDGSTS